MTAEALPVYPPSPEAVKGAHVSGMDAYRKLCAEAEADYEGYWARLARELISWKKPFTKVLDESNPPFFKWFEDGTLNASYNCLDRQVEAGLGDKVAIIFEADDGKVKKVTYRELLAQTCRLANALKARGVKKGDRVVIYVPMSTASRTSRCSSLSRQSNGDDAKSNALGIANHGPVVRAAACAGAPTRPGFGCSVTR